MNAAGPTSVRILVLASHPIQYRAPLYRRLAREAWLDLEVWYGDDYGVKPGASPWGMRDFTWDTDLHEGYPHRFFRNRAPRPGPTSRLGIFNPGLGGEVGRAAPDAVWISGYATFHNWQCLLAAWRHRIPVLYTSDSNHLAEPSGWKGRVKRWLVGAIYRNITAFLVSGTTNEKHYEAYGVPASRRFFFPWAVENERFASESDRAREEREAMRRRWGVEDGRDVVLFAGRLAPEKDPMTLVEAAGEDPKVHVVTAGSGPLQESVARRAAQRIPGRFTPLGFVNQKALPAVYAAADVLVLPSRIEPWGLVVNEALASGCPVIASDRSGAAYDLVPESLRFAPGDVGGLRRALSSWRRVVGEDPVSWSRERVARFCFDEDIRGLRAACAMITRGRETGRTA